MPRLFDTISLGKLRLKNRIVMPPMATNKATSDGEVTESQIKHYAERAKGVGLIIAEHSYVTLSGKLSPNQMGIYDDKLIAGLSKLAKAVHRHRTPIAVQINHAGARAMASVIGAQPLGPSPVLVFQETPKELSIEEIDEVVEAFGQAARRAVEAGFDAVEVHGAHGFLLNQFLSPLTNKRGDEYGGSFEKRARLPIRVFKRVRKEVGHDFTLLYRLGADDFREGGLSLNETKIFAGLLVDAGVDAIDVSAGIGGSNPPGLSGQGSLFYLAEGIKKVVDVPVVGVGGVTEAEFADEAVREGKVDLVAVGRALLADPEWAMKAVKTLKRK
jgi:2,4-dienoyl-CoA reductase-like NADH-dependent reductase (Old Yellow Enzyme family)